MSKIIIQDVEALSQFGTSVNVSALPVIDFPLSTQIRRNGPTDVDLKEVDNSTLGSLVAWLFVCLVGWFKSG
jgi:hypothetical protein